MPRLSRLVLNSIFRMGYTARYTTAVLKPYTSARAAAFYCSVSGSGVLVVQGATRRLSRQASTREGTSSSATATASITAFWPLVAKHHQRGKAPCPA